VPHHGTCERFVQDGVHLVDRRGAESGVEPVAVETLHMRRGELLELDRAEGGLQVISYEVGVSIIGALSHRAAYGALEPPVQVLAHRHILVVVVDPLDAVREHLGELRRHFLTRPAVDSLALRSLDRMLSVSLNPGDKVVVDAEEGGLTFDLLGRRVRSGEPE